MTSDCLTVLGDERSVKLEVLMFGLEVESFMETFNQYDLEYINGEGTSCSVLVLKAFSLKATSELIFKEKYYSG